ncbi:putative ribonuclease H-like domain-containing protein [Tanacetum coccineum]
MAYSSSSSDSEVSNNSNCSKSYLKTVETLKSQYDQLHKDFKKSELIVLAYKSGLESVEEKLEVYKANKSIYSQDIKVLKFEIECKDITIRELRMKLEIAQRTNDGKSNIMLGYNAVPPPYKGNFMPPTLDLSFTGLDEFVNKPVVENRKSDEEVSKVVRKSNDSPIIEDWVSDSEKENVDYNSHHKQFQKHKMVKPVWNNAQRVNHQNFAKKTHPCAKKNMVPRAVLIKFGLVSVNTARQVNAAHTKSIVNVARPMSYLSKKAHSTVKRPIHKNTTFKNSNFNQRVNTVKDKNVNTIRPKAVVNVLREINVNVVKAPACWVGNQRTKATKSQMDLQNQGVIMWMPGHMTGNMSYLTYYKQIDGGYVAFGGNPKGGKITRKVVTDDYSRFTWVFFLATKDETSGIIKSFITGIENLVDHKVKVIRCDNRTEFKNKEMNQFCEMKGILRQYIVARTPQQNKVAERRNRTLIEVARTTLANSKFPTTFWAEAVNTSCYVQNRVLVVKPHNKTPYELFHGRTPNLSFMRPFGCLVTILNTIDHLGKFDGKADEGFFVGYSLNSKAFRVFNSRTMIVEENFHIRFYKSTPNVVGSGPDWLFDIDALTRSMNYEPIVVGTQSNGFTDTEASDNAGQARKETEPKVDEDPRNDSEGNDQEKEDNVNSTNNVNAASTNKVNVVGGKTSIELPLDPNMPELEDYSIFEDDEDVGAEADMHNLDTTIQVSPIPTTRIHKDHPLDQEEPKKVIHALKDPSWIEAMQEELLQFKIEDPDFPDRVYKVEKALYGLHQAPRAWYETLSTYLLDNEFQRGKIDKTLFIKRHKGDILLVQVYVDDIIFGSTKKELCNAFEKSMIDSFMYLTSSRPDIMFAVCACARYQVNPKVSHLHAVKRIFRYLKGQPKLGLWYPKDSLFDLVAYTDSDYARASLDRKSTTGGCQFLGCRLISWQCKKQTVVANSTTEAEYVAASSCCGQVLWIQNQLLDYGPVDGKKIIITESTMRRDLQLEDAEGVDCLPNATIFEQLTLMGYEQIKQLEGMSNHNMIYIEPSPSHTKKIFRNMRRVGKGFSGRVTPLFPTMVVHNQEEMGEGSVIPTYPHHTSIIIQPSPQPQKKQKPMKPKRKDTQIPQSSGPTEHVADKAVYKELEDSLVRAATTASSLEEEQDSGNINKTRSKATLNEPSSPGTSSGSGPRCQDTMGDTIAQTRVLDLETTKTTQANEIASLKRRVKKLEKKDISRTYKLKRLYKGRKNAIDDDEDITLVNDQDDADMFDVNTLNGDEVLAKLEVVVKDVNLTIDEVTLAQALAALKSVIPKVKANVVEEPSVPVNAASTKVSTATTTTTATIPTPRKGIVITELGTSTTTTTTISSQPSHAKV